MFSTLIRPFGPQAAIRGRIPSPSPTWMRGLQLEGAHVHCEALRLQWTCDAADRLIGHWTCL